MVALPLSVTGLVVCLLLAPSRGETDSGFSAGYYPPPVSAPYPATQAGPTAPEPAAPTGTGYSLPSGINYGAIGGLSPPQPQIYPPFGDAALLGLPPACAKLMAVKTYLYTILEPLFVAFLGISAFLLVKNLLLPYLAHFSRAIEVEDEEERDLGRAARLDDVTVTVMKALARGACLERLACQAGLHARDYSVTNAVVRAIDDYSGKPDRFSAIFRAAATGQETSCDAYRCKPAGKYTKKRRLESNDVRK